VPESGFPIPILPASPAVLVPGHLDGLDLGSFEAWGRPEKPGARDALAQVRETERQRSTSGLLVEGDADVLRVGSTSICAPPRPAPRPRRRLRPHALPSWIAPALLHIVARVPSDLADDVAPDHRLAAEARVRRHVPRRVGRSASSSCMSLRFPSPSRRSQWHVVQAQLPPQACSRGNVEVLRDIEERAGSPGASTAARPGRPAGSLFPSTMKVTFGISRPFAPPHRPFAADLVGRAAREAAWTSSSFNHFARVLRALVSAAVFTWMTFRSGRPIDAFRSASARLDERHLRRRELRRGDLQEVGAPQCLFSVAAMMVSSFVADLDQHPPRPRPHCASAERLR